MYVPIYLKFLIREFSNIHKSKEDSIINHLIIDSPDSITNLILRRRVYCLKKKYHTYNARVFNSKRCELVFLFHQILEKINTQDGHESKKMNSVALL